MGLRDRLRKGHTEPVAVIKPVDDPRKQLHDLIEAFPQKITNFNANYTFIEAHPLFQLFHNEDNWAYARKVCDNAQSIVENEAYTVLGDYYWDLDRLASFGDVFTRTNGTTIWQGKGLTVDIDAEGAAQWGTLNSQERISYLQSVNRAQMEEFCDKRLKPVGEESVQTLLAKQDTDIIEAIHVGDIAQSLLLVMSTTSGEDIFNDALKDVIDVGNNLDQQLEFLASLRSRLEDEEKEGGAVVLAERASQVLEMIAPDRGL